MSREFEINMPAFGIPDSQVHGESCSGARGLSKGEYLAIAIVQGLAARPGAEDLTPKQLESLAFKLIHIAMNLVMP